MPTKHKCWSNQTPLLNPYLSGVLATLGIASALTACAAQKTSADTQATNTDTPTGGSANSNTGTGGTTTDVIPAEGSITVLGEIWADNWSALYVGDTLVMEDSVSLTTERSFNAEVVEFSLSYPAVLNFVLKDYVETDSGLEYIGLGNQQMGDGGYIAQFTNVATGELIAVTDSSMKCLSIFRAPLNKECESSSSPDQDCLHERQPEPDNWKSFAFDDSDWPSATEWDAAAVGPKDGYDEISWKPTARLVWGPDLETDNTILCRLVLEAP